MGARYYLLLVGATLVVPLCYDLFKGSKALKELLGTKLGIIKITLLSSFVFSVVLVLLKIYLMIKQLPLATKY